jgi:hypothetical protein
MVLYIAKLKLKWLNKFNNTQFEKNTQYRNLKFKNTQSITNTSSENIIQML